MGFNRSRDAETRPGWKTSACSPTGEGTEPPGKEPRGTIGAVPRGLGYQHHEIGLLVGSSEKNWAKMGHFDWERIGDSIASMS